MQLFEFPRPSRPAPGHVLSARLAERLAVANEAARRLRAMGYPIVREDVCPIEGDYPEIEIQREAHRSIRPLLELTQDRVWFSVSGKKRCRARFAGVVVTWWELPK